MAARPRHGNVSSPWRRDERVGDPLENPWTTVDVAASPDGRDLYARSSADGTLHAFRIGANGSLTPIGSVTVPDGVGGEGIAVS